MAFSHHSLIPTNEYAVQRGMERQVLTLLHHVQNPRALAASPLMAAVCQEMRTSNPVKALKRVVLAVLAGDDERATTLRNAIVDVDFKRVTSNAEIARRSGVSRRHFQRRRAEAVAAIARYARAVVTRRQSETPSMGSLERPAAWRFERERAAYLRARDRGGVLEMRAIAGNLLRLAQNQASHTLAFECRADANVRLGRRQEAEEHLDYLSPSARLLTLAKLSLLARNACEALRHARAALSAMGSDDRERYQCLAVLSQACLMHCVSWEPPATTSLPVCSWERLAMEVERARHHALALEWSDAEKLARSTQRRASLLGYHELAARSAAVLYAGPAARNEVDLAYHWRASAVSQLLPTQDRVLATGLFTVSAYNERFGMDRCLNDVLYERLCIVVPQMQGETQFQQVAVRELLCAALDSIALPQDCSGRLERAARLVARSDSAWAHYAERLRDPICEMLAMAAVAMLGLSWTEAFERLDAALADALSRFCPSAPRAIAIEVPHRPKSQSAVIDHLRFDDERISGQGSPVESPPDLCVRVLPLRPNTKAALSRQRGDSIARASGAAAGVADSS